MSNCSFPFSIFLLDIMSNVKLVIFVSLFAVNCAVNFIPNVNVKKYCDDEYRCTEDIENSVCEYKCGESEDCRNFQGFEMDDEKRQYVLDVHNFFRDLVAGGKDTRGGHSSAVNMMILNYVQEHEDVLQCYLRRCVYEEDKCRSITDYVFNGQNMFAIARMSWWNERFESGFVLINESISAWYDEVMNTNAELIDSWSDEEGEATRNVSQILWAKTLGVGCAYGKMSKGNIENLVTWHLFCNYNPSGNIEDEPMYLRGKAASDCPMGLMKSNEYRNLCGQMKALTSNRRVTSIIINGEGFYHKPLNLSTGSEMVRADVNGTTVGVANIIPIDFGLRVVGLIAFISIKLL